MDTNIKVVWITENMATNVTHYIEGHGLIYSIEWGQLNSVIHIMMSTAYKYFRKEFQDMFIHIRHNCAFQEN